MEPASRSQSNSIALFSLTALAFYAWSRVISLERKLQDATKKDLEIFPPIVAAEGQELVVTVREMRKGDCDAMISIWLAGLKQTSIAHGMLSYNRYITASSLEEYGEKATASGGDMNEAYMVEEWCDKAKEGKAMFVAVVSGSTAGEEVVVGLCGVARGTTQKGDDQDEAVSQNTFSLWRMSVYPSFRGRRVGQKLLEAVETFARSSGGCAMRCITANPIAARFYKRAGYVELAPHWIAPWHEKKL